MTPVFTTLFLALTLDGLQATVIFPQVIPPGFHQVFPPQVVPHVPPVLIHQLVKTNVVPTVSINGTSSDPQTPSPKNSDLPPAEPTPTAPEEAGNCTAEVDDKKSAPPAAPGPFVPVQLPLVPVGPAVRTVPYVTGYGFGYVPCFNCPRFVLGNGFSPYGVVG